jgi:hypothetical protein
MANTIHCTTCWASFEIAELRFIAEHPNLFCDPIAGENEQLRFRPSLFDNRGVAIDPMGANCTRIACPVCRCELPRRILHDEILPISIIGTPASGKSCLLASGLRELRRKGASLGYTLIDAAPSLNTHIHSLEETLFPQDNTSSTAQIGKTDPNDLSAYKEVLVGIGESSVPRPIHYSWRDNVNDSRTIVFHDTAGEAFLHENSITPSIEHLGSANTLIFVLDPFQDPSFRNVISKNDPQLEIFSKSGSARQDLLILETAERIRKLQGKSDFEKIDIPLVFAINKFDAWKHLLDDFDSTTIPIYNDENGNIQINERVIKNVNDQMREMLMLKANVPDWIDAIDAISHDATIVPCAPLGVSPSGDEFGSLQVEISALSPIWAHIPFLIAIQKSFEFEKKLQQIT